MRSKDLNISIIFLTDIIIKYKLTMRSSLNNILTEIKIYEKKISDEATNLINPIK